VGHEGGARHDVWHVIDADSGAWLPASLACVCKGKVTRVPRKTDAGAVSVSYLVLDARDEAWTPPAAHFGDADFPDMHVLDGDDSEGGARRPPVLM